MYNKMGERGGCVQQDGRKRRLCTTRWEKEKVVYNKMGEREGSVQEDGRIRRLCTTRWEKEKVVYKKMGEREGCVQQDGRKRRLCTTRWEKEKVVYNKMGEREGCVQQDGRKRRLCTTRWEKEKVVYNKMGEREGCVQQDGRKRRLCTTRWEKEKREIYLKFLPPPPSLPLALELLLHLFPLLVRTTGSRCGRGLGGVVTPHFQMFSKAARSPVGVALSAILASHIQTNPVSISAMETHHLNQTSTSTTVLQHRILQCVLSHAS